MDVHTPHAPALRPLSGQELDAVAGGIAWLPVLGGLAAFGFINLEHVVDSVNGFMDGFSAGFNGTATRDVKVVCEP